MTKREKEKIIEQHKHLTNEELEKLYYDKIESCLGSQCEEMYERGYDIGDIIAQEKFERWQMEFTDVIEKMCIERGIKLWRESNEDE